MRVHVVIGTCRMREAAQRLLEAVWRQNRIACRIVRRSDTKWEVWS
jgi:hypothetical protein